MSNYASYGLDTVKRSHDEGVLGSFYCCWCMDTGVKKGFSMCFSNWCICPSCVAKANADGERNVMDVWDSEECYKCGKKEVLCYLSPAKGMKIGICVECLRWASDVLFKSNELQNQFMPKIKDGLKSRKCRVCGCTQEDCHRCTERTGYLCSWAEDDLCSACVLDTENPLYKLYLQATGIEEETLLPRFHKWADAMADEYKSRFELVYIANRENYLEWVVDNLYLKTERAPHELAAVDVSPFKEDGAIASAILRQERKTSPSTEPTQASETQEKREDSPKTEVPDAYQDYLQKRNSSSITFTEMKFFEQLQKAAQGVDLTLSIKEKNGKYTVMVLPKATDQSKIQPLIVTGTPEELDKDFFPKVGPVILETTTLLINADEYKKSVEDAAKKDEKKVATAPAKTEPKKPVKKGPAAAASKKRAEKKAETKKADGKKVAPKTEETPKVIEQAMF